MKIVKYPHPVLKYNSKPLQKIDQGIRDMAAEMLDLMYEAEGVGLAANQVAVPYRLLVLNPSGTPEDRSEEHIFINPVIIRKKGRCDFNEGCLSFPDLHINVSRPEEVFFQAINLKGELETFHWKGFPARIIQHETDHLNGHCFYEQVGPLGLLKARSILNELAEIYETDCRLGLIPSNAKIMEEVRRLEQERT